MNKRWPNIFSKMRFTIIIMQNKSNFLKKVLATFCRYGKFRSFHTFLEAIQFIRSTKGGQKSFQKWELLQILFRKSRNFEKWKIEKSFWPILKYVKKYAEYGYTNHLAWNLHKWYVFDKMYFCIIYISFFVFLGHVVGHSF